MLGLGIAMSVSVSEENSFDVKTDETFCPPRSGEGGKDIFKVSNDENVCPWVSGTIKTTKMVLAAHTKAK